MSGTANKLDGIYSKFAIALRKSSGKNQTKEILQSKLYSCLNSLIPSEEQFAEQFVTLSYTKKSTASNMKCKYALQQLNSYYQNKEIFEDDSSIEHIIPECNNGISNNIGNLILLERALNTEVDNNEYLKKLEIYKKSNYLWMKEFVKQHPNWSEDMVKNRAKIMASLFYHKILSFK